MSYVNVIIRHARSAVYLCLNGAVRDIELQFDPDTQTAEYNAAITSLFQNIAQEIGDWAIPGTFEKIQATH